MAVGEGSEGRVRFTTGLALSTVAPLAGAPLLAPDGGRGTAEILGVLVVVAYAGHVAVTAWLWTDRDVRHLAHRRPWRLVGVPAALVALGAGAPLVVSGRAFGWLLLGFFVWQFTHFQRQNLGLVSAVAGRWGSPALRTSERWIVAVAGGCGTAGLVARPALLGVGQHALPPPLAGALSSVAETGLVVCVATALVCWARSTRPAPVAAAHVLAVTFMAPVFLFWTPAAAVTGTVVAHGLQYLWVVGWRTLGTQHPRRGGHDGRRTVIPIVVLAVGGGSALAAISERHGARGAVLHLLYGAYFGIVMAHFAVDSAVWRRSKGPLRAWQRTRPLLPSPVPGGC